MGKSALEYSGEAREMEVEKEKQTRKSFGCREMQSNNGGSANSRLQNKSLFEEKRKRCRVSGRAAPRSVER